jgi:hypothetical protein
VFLGSGDLALCTLGHDAVVDQKDRLVIAVLKSRDNGAQHLHRLFVVVIVEGDAEEVNASVTDGLWRRVVVLLEGHPVFDIARLVGRELMVRDVLYGETQGRVVLMCGSAYGCDKVGTTTETYLSQVDTNVTVSTTDVDDFGVLQGGPTEVIPQHFETVIDCRNVSNHITTRTSADLPSDQPLMDLENTNALSGFSSR